MKEYFIILIIAQTVSMVGNRAFAQNLTKDNKKLVTDFFSAFNHHDFTRMTAFYSENATFLDPSLGKEYVHQSHAQTQKKYSELAAIYPDLHDSVKSLDAIGNKVFVEFTASGSSKDGQKFVLPIFTVFIIKNSKIISDATYYDK